jgi:hypothetical protein
MIERTVSIRKSKFLGYQSKKESRSGKENAKITFFIANFSYDFDAFVKELIRIELIERICLELCFNKIKIKGKKCAKCIPTEIVECINFISNK